MDRKGGTSEFFIQNVYWILIDSINMQLSPKIISHQWSLIPLCRERNVKEETSHVAVAFIYRQILMTIRVVSFADLCIIFRHSLLKILQVARRRIGKLEYSKSLKSSI